MEREVPDVLLARPGIVAGRHVSPPSVERPTPPPPGGPSPLPSSSDLGPPRPVTRPRQ